LPPSSLFAREWERAYQEGDDAGVLAPFGATFPGLAEVPGPADSGAALREIIADPAAAWLGLVPVARPADVPAVLGWLGATNYFTPNELTVMLRSWEERFDTVPVLLGFDQLMLAVGRPVRTQSEALAIAAEHYVFCPDMILQEGPGSIEEYAKSAVEGAATWWCWWD